MTDADWSACGRHETLGVMDLDRQLRHFHVGHYEEHADQLDLDERPMSETWAPVPEGGSDFPSRTCPSACSAARRGAPVGVAHRRPRPRPGVAAGIDLELTARPSLNPLMASGRGGAAAHRAAELLTGPERAPELLLPSTTCTC